MTQYTRYHELTWCKDFHALMARDFDTLKANIRRWVKFTAGDANEWRRDGSVDVR